MVPAIRSHVILHRAEGSGTDRKHVAHDALVLAAHGDLLTVAFIDPALIHRVNDINWSDAFEKVFDVPPKGESDGHYFYTEVGPVLSADDKKLQAFLLSNFKSETGNETPVDCAIRLLGKTKKK
jgi:hypothetical protein